MKKKYFRIMTAALVTGMMAMSFAGCGAESSGGTAEETGTEATEESKADTEESKAEPDKSEAAESEKAEAGKDAPADAVVDESATFDNIGNYIELGDYRALNITRSKDVKTDGYPGAIGDLVGWRLTFPETDYGMTVTLDYVGTINGVAFDGGTASGADLKIGSHTFIDNFEDQLVGSKVGDVVEVKVTFPEKYKAENLAGKEALFTCTIHGIWKDLWDGFVDTCTAKKYPKDLYEIMRGTVQATNKSNAEAYGMTVEEYKKAARLKTDDEQAAIETKWALVNKALLSALGINEESEPYQKMKKTILEASGYADVDAAVAAGLTEDKIRITTEYYTAVQALLRERGLIS